MFNVSGDPTNENDSIVEYDGQVADEEKAFQKEYLPNINADDFVSQSQ